jgi:mono/diheme cytochrome c family protein
MLRIIKFGVVCLGVVLFLVQPWRGSLSIRPANAKETPLKSGSKTGASAKTLFARNCATCHGADGRGETAEGEVSGVPDMTDRKWQESISEKRMAISVRQGRGIMPSFEKKLSQSEIDSLVAHVRNFKD